MLRALVAVLVLLNAVLFAWNEGWLERPLGLVTPGGEREPVRMGQQVRPDSLTIRPGHGASGAAGAPADPGAAAAAASGASPASVPGTPASAGPGEGAASAAPPASALEPASGAASAAAPAASLVAAAPEAVCLQGGPYAPAAASAAEQALGALPAGSWRRVNVGGGAWLVYIGKFADRGSMQRQLDELTTLRIPAEEVRGLPALEPGLILSRQDSRERADAVLEDLLQRGARTARVVASGSGPAGVLLRIERADAALVRQVTALKAPALGAGFQPCPRPVG